MSTIDHYAPLPTAEQIEKLAGHLVPGGTVDHGRRIEGGLGCTMDVLDTVDAQRHAGRAALRRYGPWGKPGDDHPAPVEAHALEVAARGGVPVPELLWVDHDGVFEEPTIVISYIDGTPLTNPSDPVGWADQLAGVLAGIHAITLTEADYAVFEVARPRSGDDGVTLPEELEPHLLGTPLWSLVLGRRETLVSEEECFLHADFWPGNTLWRDSNLVAVVDWEHPAIGDPSLDVAYAVSDMRYVGLDAAADRFVATYRTITGRDLPNLAYWTAISLCRPMPDIARWHPSFVAFGHDITVAELRAQHVTLIEKEIDSGLQVASPG